jgi:baseplate J-like protein
VILSQAPSIDKRTAADVAEELQQLLGVYAPAWHEVDPSTGEPAGVSAALIGVAARFAEIIIQRLNQVPQKNFLAFLDLLGASLLPPQPARVPLTFFLAKGSTVDGVVPPGTQAAAPPAPGEKDPVIYETENELIVTAAQLASVYARDPQEDTYADYTSDIVTGGSAGTPIFHGRKSVEHILYLGQSQFLNSPGIKSLTLNVNLQSGAGDPLNLKWEFWDAKNNQWQDKTPVNAADDTTKKLTQSGNIQFGAIDPITATVINGVSREWIRCRLLTPVTPATSSRSGMARANKLPQIRSIGMRVHLHNEGLGIEAAYHNGFQIDITKDFHPFGERPRFNDTFWLLVDEAFSNPGATVTLTIKLSSPLMAPPGITQDPYFNQLFDALKLRWEIWNGQWVELGTSTPKGPVQPPGGLTFKDDTNAFTKDGQVVFTLPMKLVSFKVHGKESFWMRVSIVSGNYGFEGYYKLGKAAPASLDNPYIFVAPDFRSPSIKSISVAYDVDSPPAAQPADPPETVFLYNDSEWTDVTAANNASQPYTPFTASRDSRPTVYFGFDLPTALATFPNSAITLFFRGADLRYGEKLVPVSPDISRGAADPAASFTHKFFITNSGSNATSFNLSILGTQWTPGPTVASSISLAAGQTKEVDVQVTIPAGTSLGDSDSGFLRLSSSDGSIYSAEFVTFAHDVPPKSQQLELAWEYWSGQSWSPLVVRDATNNFTTTGTIQFLAPPDFAAHSEFGIGGWWLRVRWNEGDYDTDPRIDRILLNTTMAAQVVTVRDEVLGSSDGTANQAFKTIHVPVLSGQQLQVHEPEMPSAEELDAINEEEGADAVTVVRDAAGRPAEIWVRWHEVPDFYASDPRSRHYTLDRLTGQITFGDGVNGLIPPIGSGNLHLAVYKTGGGVRGNRAAGSIIQLKTTLPYVDKVTNYYDATGGAEMESIDSLVSRAPTELRHRRRAVTAEDYRDLAHLASPDVARALCVPNRDLIADPFDELPITPGTVTLIIVPNSTDPNPQPSIELIRRVQDFISSSSPATATVLIVGPLYVRVDVQVEIGLASLEGSGTLVQAVQQKLAAFLHPLTGGFDGEGWEFGREPHRSDIYALLKTVPGVDHIRSLTVQEFAEEDLAATRQTGRFMVYSGNHTIKLVLEPA